mmetsp:Transcript_6481/g.15977  ORF Transcript_6481/g.15977 Transcript_6481/m.15977 type:complete len:459 (+) Transcript_6481:139-1515(+)|eukprot:CAMPEP_0178998342 /NCGR_PEP_ID=MMETSP0795-20121207/9463_1 /TAXON_ID=88552 /ORGANISM="Amoebophrya sp., Strain Ameob2" /LENGTH=458 /DNA_ID=CAMNT_0020691017 /DNA_START=100 /DNA_END=1476 /DNA_ORIENTATION=+
MDNEQLASLRKDFPGWDEEDLAEVLHQFRGNEHESRAALINWTTFEDDDEYLYQYGHGSTAHHSPSPQQYAHAEGEALPGSTGRASKTVLKPSAAVDEDRRKAVLTCMGGRPCPKRGKSISSGSSGGAGGADLAATATTVGKSENLDSPARRQPPPQLPPPSAEKKYVGASTSSGTTTTTSPYKFESIPLAGLTRRSPEEVQKNPKKLMRRSEYDRVLLSRLRRKAPSMTDLAHFLLMRPKLLKWANRAKAHVGGGSAVSGTGGKGNSSSPSVVSGGAQNSSPATYPRPAPGSKGTRILDERLGFLRLQQCISDGDGNCQFRSLSRELYGTQQYHQVVRKLVCDFMAAHSDDFAPFVDGEFDDYLRDMRRDRNWGDELSLRAAADCFSVGITVVTTDEENYLLHYNVQEEGEDSAGMTSSSGVASPSKKGNKGRKLSQRQLFLCYISPVHYNSVGPMK